jgi:hypothetical protein
LFDEGFIFIPSTDTENPKVWKSLTSCVWKGPSWYNYKVRLSAIEGYQSLRFLFEDTLHVSDAGLVDFIDYLRYIKISKAYLASNDELANIIRLYNVLSGMAKDDSVGKKIRYVATCQN